MSNPNRDFNETKVRELLEKYPNLRIAFKTGLLSRRQCRMMLEISKWEMDDLYVDLSRSLAIRVLSSSAFRATPDTLNLIEKMEMEERDAQRKSHD